ncbi:hypothetical protein XENOCAPTIV_012509 [Xenoophorus captivus]|uniref:Uncharacterized protein n=1 Tax=Xenoophorus captivus TaxID=1517983 RepID=A0ABV0QS99_9TELE
MDWECAESIPDCLKLPLCVTRFWFQYRQQNHPDHQTNMSCLQALVLGLYCGPLLHKLQNALLSHSSTFTELKVLLAERRRVLLETLLRSAGVGPSAVGAHSIRGKLEWFSLLFHQLVALI